ncbi:MAG: guanylate kinase [Clostridiales bacterium]|jgi:guanylate kinase|nr:guanylate kinase [Clostridiales bacterium]
MAKGVIIIISGPSGSGKGTVVRALAAKDPQYALSVSMTTRTKRPQDIDGVEYLFVSEEEFKRYRDSDQFLEHAQFVGNLYGTPRFYVEEQVAKGKTVLLEIEVNGALQVKERYPECVLIFLMPPNFDELKRRLISRGTEDMVTIENRVIRARDEIKLINAYDYLVINDEVESAVESIGRIVYAESLRPARQEDVVNGYITE